MRRPHRSPTRGVTAAAALLVGASWLGGVLGALAPASAAVGPGRASPRVTVLNTPTWEAVLPDNGAPIALSSPIPTNLDGQPSVVVGDRLGYLYAFHLAGPTGSPPAPTPVAGWQKGVTDESGPIDSTPSITTLGGQSVVLVGSGNDSNPTAGGYQAYSAAGSRLWFAAAVNPPSDAAPATGVQAGLTVGNLQPGGPDLVAGSLGQVSYALSAQSGDTLTGWPFFNSDSTHSTAAVADLYGTGQTEIAVGGDQSAGTGQGQTYADGGHLRILSGDGNQICRADTNQVVDSSPAVGGFLPGGATGVVVAPGAYFPGASDTGTVKAYDTHCRLQWSADLGGSSLFSSPALSGVLGNGSLQVVEGTNLGSSGSVWVLDAATGRTLWNASVPAQIIGSVVTADLSGNGYDDVIVPTLDGAWVFDGRSGQPIEQLSPGLGLQNSPLVTDDPDGNIGITLAGYSGVVSGGIGVIDHYELPGTNGAAAIGGSAWPMFHHDPQLTGDAGGTPARGSIPACSVPAAVATGYELAASDGGVFSFGGAPFCGSTGNIHLNAPVVGISTAPSTGGYWEVASDGGVFAFGDAGFYGSMGGQHLNQPIVGMAATPDGKGYWEVASDGGIFAFGDAGFYGSMGGHHLNQPVVGISTSTDGTGYRLAASDGGIFSFGDAPFRGSMGNRVLNKPVVGTANDTNTGGYWEVASDGGIFSFGGAPFFGSTGGQPLAAPVVGMSETANGSGYRLTASDGGTFSFAAPFLGSMGGSPLNRPIVGMAGF